jgi:hypothetical protein
MYLEGCLNSLLLNHHLSKRYTYMPHANFKRIKVGDERLDSSFCRFTPREKAPGTHWIEGSVGPRANLDDVETRKFLTLPRLEIIPLGRPARSQSLYRLTYPGVLSKKLIRSIVIYIHICMTNGITHLECTPF